MNWVDIVILVVWGVTALWGYSAGILQILVPFVSLIVGLALAGLRFRRRSKDAA